MVDLSQTILAKSDQLNADDLMAGAITVKITNVTAGNSAEQPIKIEYEKGDGRPYYPCKSMRRVFTQAWGNDGKSYIGKSMTLYRDPEVMYAGIKVGGIRVSHMSDIKGKLTLALTERRGSKKPYTVLPLSITGSVGDDPEYKELKKQGDEAASKGVADYTAWKDSLTESQKNKIKPSHKAWSAIATAQSNQSVEEEYEQPEDDLPA